MRLGPANCVEERKEVVLVVAESEKRERASFRKLLRGDYRNQCRAESIDERNKKGLYKWIPSSSARGKNKRIFSTKRVEERRVWRKFFPLKTTNTVFARRWNSRERERVAGGRRQENCKRWEAVGRKNRGSALVKEIIRGLIKYSAISSASIAGCRVHLKSRIFRISLSLSLRSFPFPSVSSSSRNHRGLGGGRIRISKIHAKTFRVNPSQSRGSMEKWDWTNPVVNFSLN